MRFTKGRAKSVTQNVKRYTKYQTLKTSKRYAKCATLQKIKLIVLVFPKKLASPFPSSRLLACEQSNWYSELQYRNLPDLVADRTMSLGRNTLVAELHKACHC